MLTNLYMAIPNIHVHFRYVLSQGEYFIQNGAGGYAEPGVIIREVDNTATVDSLSSQIVDSTNDTFQIQFKLNQTTGSTTATGHLNYQIMGQFDTIA